MSMVLTQTIFPGLQPVARGKVRDIYSADGGLVMVATDRISAYDCILGTPIPLKGRVLTQLSIFWFDLLQDIIPHHLLTADPAMFPAPFPQFADQLDGRAMFVKQARPIPIECVVRGYLSGSAWKEYKASGQTAGITLSTGLRESDRLNEPMFTPATKAQSGHDENISFEQMVSQTGKTLATHLRDVSIALYQKASAYARDRGVMLADTKFEFGIESGTEDGSSEGKVILIDEALTPDSSRYWPLAQYQPGGPQPSYDKQFVRDYVESIGWNKQLPAPQLPADVVAKTTQKYLEIFSLLTGRELA
ncbi:MAG: phosphoribosylaminoimidazolesuccinocarboxamide synthase [Acidobacteria bacterium]|nr:phosphoribosylaminoimidazolesuccinocarboxamide synthase [Acidobacteriota bacterium]